MGRPPAGQLREDWTVGDERTTMLLMISGRFRLETTVDKVVLKRQGDYVIWGPGIDHAWEAEEDSVVVTVRWPSIP